MKDKIYSEELNVNKSKQMLQAVSLLPQLEKWIKDCEIQAEIFIKAEMQTSKISSNAMAQAYWNVKSLIEVNCKQKDSKETETNPECVVYSIGYGQYADSGRIEKLAKNEEAIINLVKNDEYVHAGQCVTEVTVDFVNKKVYYEYKDWDDKIEQGTLYLTKFDVIG